MAEWEYLMIKELAATLQLNQQTVRNWVNAGELDYVKFGRTSTYHDVPQSHSQAARATRCRNS